MANIYGICLVKDEADVISQCLISACAWCDRIYVYDNGSSDDTWEKVHALAQEYLQIIPFKREAKVFSNSLRSEVFNHYRERAKDGDWWCILDADEFYIDDPRIFLAKIPAQYQVVWNASFQFYFTDVDLEEYSQSKGSQETWHFDFANHCYYRNNWSELRFFRHKRELIWPKDSTYPKKLGAVYPVRIWLKHYQYRSPDQIQRRLENRYQARKPFIHEVQRKWAETVLDTSLTSQSNVVEDDARPDWRSRVMPAAELDYDDGSNQYIVREDLMPAIPVNLWNDIKTVFCNLKAKVKRIQIMNKARL